jgi:peptidoglycan/xylan/chitin deacetylase (PgdA/CDA1 family)
MQLPILVYHYFGTSRKATTGIKEEDVAFITPVDLFIEHLGYLKGEGYEAISFETLLAARRGEKQLPPKPIIISIDDGHRSVAEFAAPELRKMRWPAELFVIPARVGDPGYLQWQELRELGTFDLASQSHGMTHRLLNRLSAEEVEAELAESKRLIGEKTGIAVQALAVPMGGYPRMVYKVSLATGYRVVCTSYYGMADTDGDLFHLPRIMMRSPYDAVPKLAALLHQEPGIALPLRLRNLAKRIKNACIGMMSGSR